MIDIVFLKFMKIRVDIFIDIDSNCITIKNASTIKKVSEIWMNETYNIIYIEPDISRWDCWAEHYNSGHCFSVIIHLNKSPEKKTRSLQPGYTGRLQSCGSSPQRIISQSFFLQVFGAEFLRFRGVVESEQLQHPDPGPTPGCWDPAFAAPVCNILCFTILHDFTSNYHIFTTSSFLFGLGLILYPLSAAGGD